MSTSLSPVTASDVKEEFGKKIKFIIDGGKSSIGLESTIVDLTNKPKILRYGGITSKDLKKILKVNIKTILKTKDHSAEINGALAKSASGALEYIDIIKVTNLSMSLSNLKKKGFIIIGLDENSDVLLNNLNNYKNSKIVLVFGSEGKGLRRLTKERCDLLISINNNNDGNFTTLNVSTAAAVTLYELMDKNI